MNNLNVKQLIIVFSSPVLVIIMGLIFYIPVSIYLCNNSGIVYYYATDGVDSKNIFISTEIDKETGVLTSINTALNDCKTIETYDEYDTKSIAAYKLLKKIGKLLRKNYIKMKII